MGDRAAEYNDTFLTERQVQVLTLRSQGLTQREIADRLGTSVSNISSIETAARNNIHAARQTLNLARLLQTTVRFRAAAGPDLRDVVDTIYKQVDATGQKVNYTDPELATHLHSLLDTQLDGRKLTTTVTIGITNDGDVVAYPMSINLIE